MLKQDLNYSYFIGKHECGTNIQKRCCQYPCLPRLCYCIGATGADGKSAYQVALDNGYIGTATEWLDSLIGATGATGATGTFRSSYIEAIGNEQIIAVDNNIIFDIGAVDSVGNNIVLNSAGTTFTVNQTGLYHIEWNINLAPGSAPAVVGIIENGRAASGATSSTDGSFSSGTLIEIDTVPFTISLYNYYSEITLENPFQWENSAASIRIVRFADEPS